MANTFINATLKANTSGSLDIIYTTPAATTTLIHGLFISNVGDTTLKVDLKMLDASAETTSSLITRAKILPGSTLSWDKPINLETLDSLRLAPDRNNSTEVVASVLQIT